MVHSNGTALEHPPFRRPLHEGARINTMGAAICTGEMRLGACLK